MPTTYTTTPTPAPSEAGVTSIPVAVGTVGSVVAPKATSTAEFKGAANKLSGAGVAGFLGLAALLV